MIPTDTNNEEVIRNCMEKSDLVINMIGKDYETKHVVPTRRENGELSRVNYSFEQVNIDIPRKLARLAKESGVKTFIHISHLSADIDSASKNLRTKYLGELAVQEEFPEAVIYFTFINILFLLINNIFSLFIIDYC